MRQLYDFRGLLDRNERVCVMSVEVALWSSEENTVVQ